MERQSLLEDVRLGYTEEMQRLYQQALIQKIPAVRPEFGQFLSMVVALVQPHKVLEIGTGSGYSTLWLLRCLPQGGKIVTLERDERRYREALALFYQKPVEVFHADARSFLAESPESFDMVFLDAEKRLYVEFLPLITPRLRKGGGLVVDNLFGHHLHQSRTMPLPAQPVLRAFYELLWESGEYRVFAFSWEDGILVAQKL
ncbi:O-methyltransferase [Thermospira aquatica]|uniref:Class I SAM-dependent methyltransferase n=1 Tax=Thermospira aquatica TaxID=2828656 RepID=A0AAX3BEU1_9SPIR|nr:class I SAM-dependent methyltransferase [Thermospira aquatica]URA10660.1 class I SAM-dependent methyltransferase [Thermospira aquatica]